MGLVVLIGSATGLVLVIRARSAPDVPPRTVVNAFLTLAFTDHDLAGAMKKVSSAPSDEAQVRGYLDVFVKQSSGGAMLATWNDFRELITARHAIVTTDATVTFTFPQNPPQVLPYLWVFSLRVEHGQWRISHWGPT